MPRAHYLLSQSAESVASPEHRLRGRFCVALPTLVAESVVLPDLLYRIDFLVNESF